MEFNYTNEERQKNVFIHQSCIHSIGLELKIPVIENGKYKYSHGEI